MFYGTMYRIFPHNNFNISFLYLTGLCLYLYSFKSRNALAIYDVIIDFSEEDIKHVFTLCNKTIDFSLKTEIFNNISSSKSMKNYNTNLFYDTMYRIVST